MFAQIDDDFLDKSIATANEWKRKNDEKYHNARAIIRDYVVRNDLIMSDPNVLLGKDVSPISRVYCMEPIKHARKIADVLYGISKWVKMTTVVENEEATVYFNTEIIASVLAIKRHKINIKKLISPVDVHGVKYMPPELELIDAYQDAYKPSPVEDIDHESLLKMVIDRIDKKIIGGKKKCSDCDKKRRVNMDNLKLMIFEHFGGSHVVVGHWSTGKSAERLQFISGDVAQSIRDIILFLQKFTQFEVTYTQNKLHIPKDFRTNRYIMSIQYPSIDGAKPIKKPFLDIFNSGEFDLIPYTKKAGKMIGSPFVLLRFMLIDLWIIRLVYKMDLISKDLLERKMRHLADHISKVAKQKPQDYEYFGVWKEFSVEKKLNSLKKRMHYPYYPHLDKK